MHKLHLGCGKRHIDGFTHIDIADFPHIDYKHDIRTLPMIDDSSVELIYACHVLEYFDRQEVCSILREWGRTLVPDGILRVAVPDFDALVNAYERFGQLDLIHGPLYGRWETGNEVLYHKTAYDYQDLKWTLETSGYYNVHRYDWQDTIHKDYDDYSQAYIPHLDRENGLLISLNVECKKLSIPGEPLTCCT